MGPASSTATWDWAQTKGLPSPQQIEVAPGKVTSVTLETHYLSLGRVRGVVENLSPEFRHWVTWTFEPAVSSRSDWPIRFGIEAGSRQIISSSGDFELPLPIGLSGVLCVVTEVDGELLPTLCERRRFQGNQPIYLEWNPSYLKIESNSEQIHGARLSFSRNRRNCIRWTGSPRLLKRTPVSPGEYHFRSSDGVDLRLTLQEGEERVLRYDEVNFVE